MASISKEESAVIDKMFSWCASSSDMVIIKKSILEVKNGNGLCDKAINCKGDLYSFKSVVAEHTGLALKVSGELGRVLYHLVKPYADRERMIRAGIAYGTWMNSGCECPYSSHSRLHGKNFPLNRGVRIGLFKRILPNALVGCRCFIKPTLPF